MGGQFTRVNKESRSRAELICHLPPLVRSRVGANILIIDELRRNAQEILNYDSCTRC